MTTEEEPNSRLVAICLKTLKEMGSKDPEETYRAIREMKGVQGESWEPNPKAAAAFWLRDLTRPYGIPGKISLSEIQILLNYSSKSTLQEDLKRYSRYVDEVTKENE